MAETVELKDLVGKHTLSGVDYFNERVADEWGGGFEDCQVMSFVLDDKAYSAIENPGDGYRSMLREVRVVGPALVKNRFEPIEVLAIYRDRSRHDSADLLQVYDTANAKLVLEVGTDHSDDYYPSFIAEFTPENMSINEDDDR